LSKPFTPESLLRHLLTTLGLGSAVLGSGPACGGSTAEPALDAGASDATVDDRMSSDMSSMGDRDEGGIVIVPPPPDAANCRPLVIERRQTLPSEVCPDDAGNASRVYSCLPSPPSGQTCQQTYDEPCVLQTYTCGVVQRGTTILCGPLPGPTDAGSNDACCYVVTGGCAVGRPFIVAGVARVAVAGDDPSWAQALHPDTAPLDLATRAALADVWTQDALTEHASVASFSRFVLQCLSLGAPADIVESAQQACADEIEHCRIAFGLASAYAGRPVGPGSLATRGALDDSLDPAAIACSVVREGCIAETVSAALVAVARDNARDPVVRAALDRMAEQECEHALLAWRYLRWALSRGDEQLARDVARIFARMEHYVGLGADTSRPAYAKDMRAHGYLPREERRRIARSVLIDVIRPAAQTLLATAARGDRSELSVA
jgi:hypothetical protein